MFTISSSACYKPPDERLLSLDGCDHLKDCVCESDLFPCMFSPRQNTDDVYTNIVGPNTISLDDTIDDIVDTTRDDGSDTMSSDDTIDDDYVIISDDDTEDDRYEENMYAQLSLNKLYSISDKNVSRSYIVSTRIIRQGIGTNMYSLRNRGKLLSPVSIIARDTNSSYTSKSIQHRRYSHYKVNILPSRVVRKLKRTRKQRCKPAVYDSKWHMCCIHEKGMGACAKCNELV